MDDTISTVADPARNAFPLVGRRNENQYERGANLTPQTRRFDEADSFQGEELADLGFPHDWWLPPELAKHWRGNDYPRHRTRESCEQWEALQRDLICFNRLAAKEVLNSECASIGSEQERALLDPLVTQENSIISAECGDDVSADREPDQGPRTASAVYNELCETALADLMQNQALLAKLDPNLCDAAESRVLGPHPSAGSKPDGDELDLQEAIVRAVGDSLKQLSEGRTPLAATEAPPARNGAPEETADETCEPRKRKRSTKRGEALVKLIAALTKHHNYADGSSLNLDPIGNNELAELAVVSPSTACLFFKKQFGGYSEYVALCRNERTTLGLKLGILNGDAVRKGLTNFGRSPPNEGIREDD